MKEHALPSHIRLGQTDHSFGEIYTRFANTPHGEKLRQNIRYSTFKPDSTSNTTWERILGSDVNNLTHLNLTRGLTRSFLTHCATSDSDAYPEATFTKHEQGLLLLTATVHDWGEAVVGDIAYTHKTKADETNELVALRSIVHEIFGDNNAPHALDEITTTVADILSDTTSKLGKAFNAIERVGYVRTGLRAWEQSGKTQGELRDSLEDMGLKVVPYHIPFVLTYSELYPPVDGYVHHHKEMITQIFCEAEKKSINRGETQFLKAKNAWDRRLRNQ